MLDIEDIKQTFYALLILLGLLTVLIFWILLLGIGIFNHNIILLSLWTVITLLIMGACLDTPW